MQMKVTKGWTGHGNKAMNVSMGINYKYEEEIYNKIL